MAIVIFFLLRRGMIKITWRTLESRLQKRKSETKVEIHFGSWLTSSGSLASPPRVADASRMALSNHVQVRCPPAKMATRKKLDPSNAVKVWRLNVEDLASIRMIARQARHPYNFVLDSKTDTSLEEFMESWEETFPFAQADVLDKWKVNSLNAEAFDHYIDRSKLTVPGTLSATTTAKLIVYLLVDHGGRTSSPPSGLGTGFTVCAARRA